MDALFQDMPSGRLGPRAPSDTSSPSRPPSALPTNSQIEAAIQKAQAMSPARLVPDRTGSSLGRDTRMQLFVGNLPYRVRWQDLKDLFRKAGTVLRADVSLGPDNRSRGYGTVLFGNPEDAQRAIEIYNGYSWQSRVLEVRPDRLPPDFDLGLQAPPNTFNVLPSPMHAMQFIPPPPGTLPLASGAPKFEGFDDSQPIPSPMAMFFPSVQSQDRNRVPSASGRTLFVGNLPFHCQWQDLKDLFRQAGSVLRADVVLGADGRSRGHGTVSFSNDSDADNALKMFNGYEFNGRPLKVHYDKYTGQNTPLTSASPAPPGLPPMGGMPFMYSAIPSYLAPALHHMAIGLPPSLPHSPFDLMPSKQPSPPPAQQQQTGLTVDSLLTTRATSPRSPRSPRNLHIEINKEKEKEILARDANLSSASTGKHHAHPGPIALPPQGQVFPIPLSPHSTTAGPPITPSMPSFSFAPQAQPTPPLHAHFLSPGIGPFSPTMSPGGFFAGPIPHPTPGSAPLNPAPGAPVRYGPVMLPHPHPHPHPHSPVTAVPPPPGSPGFYIPAYYATGPLPGSPGALGPAEGYFPPIHMPPPPQQQQQQQQQQHFQRQHHPLAQEHTPPTSDSHTPSAPSGPGRANGHADYFTPLPPPPADRSTDASPASVFSASEDSGVVEQSSPGTSLTPSEVGVGSAASKQRRPSQERSASESSAALTDGTAYGSGSGSGSGTGVGVGVGGRSKSTGTHSAAAGRTTFTSIVTAQRARDAAHPGLVEQQQQPSSSSSPLPPFEDDDEGEDGAAVPPGAGATNGTRERRASWHVESPSVEGPRGAGVSYFALDLPSGR